MKKFILWALAILVGLPLLMTAITLPGMLNEVARENEAQPATNQAVEAAFAAAEAEKISKERQTTQLVTDLCLWSQKAVKNQLRAPATAQFPTCVLGISDYTIKSDEAGSIYMVLGHVDSQNGFGALIRSKFAVKFERPSPGAQLNITKVVIE